MFTFEFPDDPADYKSVIKGHVKFNGKMCPRCNIETTFGELSRPSKCFVWGTYLTKCNNCKYSFVFMIRTSKPCIILWCSTKQTYFCKKIEFEDEFV